jgi:predicted dehydrogenase
MIKFGLIGAGAWGVNYIHVLDSLPDVRLIGICRSNPDRIPESATSDVRISSDAAQIFKTCDAVIIASPPETHVQYALDAIHAGIPIILEKPCALSLNDTERILNASVSYGVPVLVNYIHLFSPAFLLLRSKAQSLLSYSITSMAGNAGPYRDYSALYDWGPHDLAMIYSIVNRAPDFIKIRRFGSVKGEIFDINLQFESVSSLSLIGNGMTTKQRRFCIVSASDTIIYDDVYGNKLILNDNPISVPSSSPLTEMVKTFIRCVQSGHDDWRFDPNISLTVSRIIDNFRA